MMSFGRLWATLTHFKSTMSAEFEDYLPELLSDLFKRWKWRLNICNDVELLVVARL